MGRAEGAHVDVGQRTESRLKTTNTELTFDFSNNNNSPTSDLVTMPPFTTRSQMPLACVRVACASTGVDQTELLVAVQDYLLPLAKVSPQKARRKGGSRLVALWHEAAAIHGLALTEYTPLAIFAGIQAGGAVFLKRVVAEDAVRDMWTSVAHHAVRANDRGVLQLLHENVPQLDVPKALAIAAIVGDLRLLEWIHTVSFGGGSKFSETVVWNAAGYGHLEIVQWCLETHAFPDKPSVLRCAMDQAARYGHFDVLRWLCAHSVGVWWSTHALGDALMNGHYEIATWIHQENEHRLLSYAYGNLDPSLPVVNLEVVVREAFGKGDLRLLDWLWDRTFLRWFTNRNTERARRAGHVQVLEWLLNRFRYADADEFKFEPRSAVGGSIAVAQWAHARGWLCKSTSVVAYAARHGHGDFIRWYTALFDGEMEQVADRHGLETTAAKGHLDCVRLLVEKGFATVTAKAIERAVTNGHFEVAQFLVHWNFSDRVALDSDRLSRRAVARSLATGMDQAAAKGRLEIRKWVKHLGSFYLVKDSPANDAADDVEDD